MTPFTAQVITTIRNIPAGKIMTYGQTAAYAGSPRAARQVVRILHAMSRKYELPWHRVVNAAGAIALKQEDGAFIQKKLLELEDVVVNEHNCIDLRLYRYDPYEP